MTLPTKQEALELLEKHVKDEYQKLHAKMVALAMESTAVFLSLTKDEQQLWYITGLLHDLDYEEFPEEHPQKALEWFKEWGFPEELIRAVDCHYVGRGPEPESALDAALIACDELSGFLYAYALMRPNGFEDMEYKGVKKRLKDKSFAAKINRDDINFGIEKLAGMLGKNADEFKKEHADRLIEVFRNMDELK